MNIKKNLVLFVIIFFISVLSNNVFATIPEGMSEELKSILNEEGKLVLTDTSNSQNKNQILIDVFDKYVTNQYGFYVEFIDEQNTICRVKRYEKSSNIILESYDVEVVYEEKYSDEFKKLTEDGSITIKASREEGKQILIESYCFAFADENVSFVVCDVNEEGTLCTIQMHEYKTIGNVHTSVLKEQHIIKVQYDKTMSENFKKHLNQNGKFVINSIIPKDESEWGYMYEVLFYNDGIEADRGYLAEDFSSCEITIKDKNGIPETHKVEFEYNYDEKVKEYADKMFDKIQKNEMYLFNVKDMELVNYWINGEKIEENQSTFDNYSSEFKEFVDYKNFSFFINNRLGADSEFFTLRGGIGIVQHNGITYYINDMMGTIGNHILYVPDNTESTKEALVEAIQKRVDEYLGNGKVKIVAGENTILEYQENKYNNEIKKVQNLLELEKVKEKPDLMVMQAYESELEYIEYRYNYFIENYNNPDGEYYFLQNAEGNWWFVAIIDGVEHKFIVIKDSEKMFEPQYKTIDIKTDVGIFADSNDIPLDTFIEVKQLTEGEEYEKIIKILDVETNETFDINLYSQSVNDYIKRLENGEFEVRIPVTEKLKNKKLVVYYVDENGNKEEHNVEIKDGYAIFTTNHFSIYTLAEEKLKLEEDIVSDNKENINDSVNTGNIGNDAENNGENKENNISNPKTGDNIVFFGVMFIISLIGIIFTTGLKKEDKEK